jgi:8-oxo-dGTP pyrophosphatase MutT (NUDIX family)
MNSKKHIARAVIIYQDRVLFLLRSDKDENRPGELDLPGGGIEPSDLSVELGVVREVNEETGLDVSSYNLREVNIPGGLDGPLYQYKRHVFVCVVDNEDVAINPEEHKGYLWIPISESVAMFTHASYAPALKYIIDNRLF